MTGWVTYALFMGLFLLGAISAAVLRGREISSLNDRLDDAVRTIMYQCRVTQVLLRRNQILTDGLVRSAQLCREYAEEQGAHDGLGEPPEELKGEPWLSDIQASCVAMRAEDSASLVADHSTAVLDEHNAIENPPEPKNGLRIQIREP